MPNIMSMMWKPFSSALLFSPASRHLGWIRSLSDCFGAFHISCAEWLLEPTELRGWFLNHYGCAYYRLMVIKNPEFGWWRRVMRDESRTRQHNIWLGSWNNNDGFKRTSGMLIGQQTNGWYVCIFYNGLMVLWKRHKERNIENKCNGPREVTCVFFFKLFFFFLVSQRQNACGFIFNTICQFSDKGPAIQWQICEKRWQEECQNAAAS